MQNTQMRESPKESRSVDYKVKLFDLQKKKRSRKRKRHTRKLQEDEDRGKFEASNLGELINTIE